MIFFTDKLYNNFYALAYNDKNEFIVVDKRGNHIVQVQHVESQRNE